MDGYMVQASLLALHKLATKTGLLPVAMIFPFQQRCQ
jgi:hypothetical protein